jgi:thymidylate synthase
MEFIAGTLDDLLLDVYPVILREGATNPDASRGTNRELLAATLRLTNPRARLSRSESRGRAFSAVGELLWYLSGNNQLEFIEPYISAYSDEVEEDGTIYGAYGPRLMSMREGINQLDNVATLLAAKPGTRRAVVQLFNAEDIHTEHKEVPCTTTLQFHRRDERLHLSVTMRSNDAYLGLPHDVFCFTMIQEMMTKRLGLTLGEYFHHAGSLHLYEKHFDGAERFVEEGYQREWPMPPMPDGNPFDLVPILIEAERRARAKDPFDAAEFIDVAYWQDIIRLLQTRFASDRDTYARLRESFSDRGYWSYLDQREFGKDDQKRRPAPATPVSKGAK